MLKKKKLNLIKEKVWRKMLKEKKIEYVKGEGANKKDIGHFADASMLMLRKKK